MAAAYKRLAGAANDAGIHFEVKTTALLNLRALNSTTVEQFVLATNVAGAGALDDIVFKVRTAGQPWASLFVQLKHKDNNKSVISLGELKKTGKNSMFSLLKYFESFLEIEETMVTAESDSLFEGCIESSRFIIFTNAKASDGLGCECAVNMGSIPEELLESGSGSIVSFDPESNPKVFEDLLDFLGTECKQNQEKAKFFLEHLLFCGQPSPGYLDDPIKQELKKLAVESKKEIDLKTWLACYLNDMKDWCESKGTATALDETSDLITNATNRALVQSCTRREQEQNKLDVLFREDTLAAMRDVLNAAKSSVLHIESSEATSRLSCTKVLQATEGSCLYFSIDCVLRHLSSIVSELEARKQNTLVIVVKESDSIADCLKVIQSVSMVSAGQEHRIVILSSGNKNLVKKLASDAEHSFGSFNDTFELSQFTEKTRDNIFNNLFNIQGHSTCLEKFFGGDSDQPAVRLNGPSVVEIFGGQGRLSFGPVLNKDIPYFLSRTVEQASAFSDGIFSVESLSESITIHNSKMDYIHSILLQSDSSLAKQQIFNSFKKFLKPGHSDENKGPVFIKTKFLLGSFDCCFIGLREGQVEQVTAVRIRPQKDKANRGWFLFVDGGMEDKDVATLSEFNESKHFFCLEDNKMQWKKSTGNLNVIRRHIDETHVTALSSESVNAVGGRIVLLCAEPGMGKTILMAHIASQTKREFPESWVISIGLNNHAKLFKDNLHVDAFRFLVAATKLESPFEQLLLQEALEKYGNLFLLLDGFDEISPTYADKCCVLLSSLLKTKARKIWITSRNTMKGEIEDHLHIFALRLRKFNENDQRNFFKKYWQNPALNEEILDEFITSLLKMTNEAFSDREKDFMGVPLQTRMIAEVHEDYVTGKAKMSPSLKKLDSLQLLDQFIDKKLDIYAKHKLHMKDYETDYEFRLHRLKQETNSDYMRAGLVAILSDKDLESLHLQTVFEDSSALFEGIRSGRDKTGIIDCIVNDKPRFVHRVYAEYFVALWFAKYFAENVLFLENNLYTVNFRVVRDIFDRILSEGHRLHTSVLNRDVEEIRKLVSREEVDVNATDIGGRTALHLAATFGAIEDEAEVKRYLQILDILVSPATDIKKEDKVLKGSSLKYADITSSWIVIDKLLARSGDATPFVRTKENIKDQHLLDYVFIHDLDRLMGFYLDVQDLEVDHFSRNSERLLPKACEVGSLRIATLLVESGANIYENASESRSPFHLACEHGHLPIAELILRTWLRNKSRDIKADRASTDIINRGDRYGITPILLAAQKGHVNIVRFLLEQGANIRDSSRFDRNAMHVAVRHPDIVELLIDAVPKAEERAVFLDTCDQYGNTAVHLAAIGGCVESLALLVAAGGTLGRVGAKLLTALMVVAGIGHKNTVEHVLDLAEATGTPRPADAVGEPLDRLSYIDLKDSAGKTALQLAALCGHAGVVGFLLGRGADGWSHDRYGRTSLHDAVLNDHLDVVWLLLDRSLGSDAFVDACDGSGNTAVHLAARNGHCESLELLVRAGGKLGPVGAKQSTALMLAAEGGHRDMVEFILNREARGGDGFPDMISYIDLRDADGKTALHYASERNRYEVVCYLLELGADSQSCDEEEESSW